MRLDVVGIGPPKTGTTWLDHVLRLSGRIGLPRPKETFFWDREFHRGMHWYEKFFRGLDPELPRGEIGSTYIEGGETVLRRLVSHNPEIVVIVTLRDPVERSISRFDHFLSRGEVEGGLLEAAEARPDIIAGSLYGTILEPWVGRLPRKRMLVLILEEMTRDAVGTVRRIGRMIDEDPWSLPSSADVGVRFSSADFRLRSLLPLLRRLDRGLHRLGWTRSRDFGRRLLAPLRREGTRPAVPPDVREWLHDRFAPEVEKAENLLGISLPSSWKG